MRSEISDKFRKFSGKIYIHSTILNVSEVFGSSERVLNCFKEVFKRILEVFGRFQEGPGGGGMSCRRWASGLIRKV